MMFGLILLVIVVFYLNNSQNPEASRSMNYQSHAQTAQEILHERYARGEISREDFLERKQELSGQKQLISIKKG